MRLGGVPWKQYTLLRHPLLGFHRDRSRIVVFASIPHLRNSLRSIGTPVRTCLCVTVRSREAKTYQWSHEGCKRNALQQMRECLTDRADGADERQRRAANCTTRSPKVSCHDRRRWTQTPPLLRLLLFLGLITSLTLFLCGYADERERLEREALDKVALTSLTSGIQRSRQAIAEAKRREAAERKAMLEHPEW